MNCWEVWHVGTAGYNLSRVQSGLYVLYCCRERYSLVGGTEWHGVEGQVLVTQRLHWCTRERDITAVASSSAARLTVSGRSAVLLPLKAVFILLIHVLLP